MKKYLLVAAAVVASPRSRLPEGLSGAYAGVRVGHVSTKAEMKDSGVKTNYGASAFAGDIVAGYGMLMDSFYLGGEAIVGFDGTNQKLNDTTKLKGGFSAGVAARLGYALTQKSMIYVSLGVSSDKTKVQTSPSVKAKSKNLVAFVPGIGTQIAMTDAVAVRADFTYSLAKKLKVSDTVTVQPKKAAFKVGVVYSF